MEKKTSIAVMIILMISSLAFSGCDSDIPEPVEEPGMFHPADSAFLYELVKVSAGLEDGFLNGKLLINFPDIVNNLPYDLPYVITVAGAPDENGQQRITGLRLSAFGECTQKLVIPESIRNLEYLNTLEIIGEGWTGDMPDYLADLRSLRRLTVIYTNYTSLPDNLFNENLEWVQISYNNNLTSLPSSVLRLRTTSGFKRKFLIRCNDNLTGTVPPITHASIGMDMNNFTSFDWRGTRRRYRGDDGQVYYTGACLELNNISGMIPDSILNDTVKIYDFRTQLGWQHNGGFSNMPSDDELEKMRREYLRNHPEDSLFAAKAVAQ